MTKYNEILSQLPPMLSGNELLKTMTVLPEFDGNIRFLDNSTRLMALSELFDVYIPSAMSMEIYSKLYLSLVRSLQKKNTISATVQRNLNHNIMCGQASNGILGGSDSFTIIGNSGLGKSASINKAIEVISRNKVIETQEPYNKIIPFVTVQCPFDASVKGLMLEILRKVDEAIGSEYYSKALKIRITTDMLIGCVSQVAVNHIGVLVVDEIQNVVANKHGKNLVGMLTQLINNSGISICMVGIPDCEEFFSSETYLARRTVGLKYFPLECNEAFANFCIKMFDLQVLRNKTEISESVIYWLYEHSGGIVSNVVSLLHDAQEIAILSGREILDIPALNEAFNGRMSMLHGHIQVKKVRHSRVKANKEITKETEDNTAINITVSEIISKAKAEHKDIFKALSQYFTVERISL